MIQHARVRRSLLALVLALAACGGDDDPGSVTDEPDPTAAPATETSTEPSTSPSEDLTVVAGEPFPAARCAANEAAGTITFLTGFDYAAASSIVEVITAEDLGYYDELCLDVEIVSSFSTANYPLVAGGEGQFASGGSFSEVVAFAAANEADLVTVTVAGTTPIDTLIVKPGTATELADLAGSTIGVKGKLPASIEVMLLGAGLVAEEDFTTVLLDGARSPIRKRQRPRPSSWSKPAATRTTCRPRARSSGGAPSRRRSPRARRTVSPRVPRSWTGSGPRSRPTPRSACSATA
jgi:hypothetical protein